MTKEELLAEYSHEQRNTIRGSDDSDDRWSVKKFRSNGSLITAVGCCRKDRLQPGNSYTLFGSWKIDDRFGRQFQFTSIAAAEPIALGAIQRYLTRAKGIGPQTAAKIVSEYGDTALVACRERPCEVESRVGIQTSVMIELSNVLITNKRLEKITIEVESILHGRGFPKQLPQKVIGKWGAEACEMIRDNPYCLREFDHVGFLLCDALYEHLGLPMDALIRQTHCVLYSLEADNTGSTWIARSQIVDELRKKISGAKVRAEDAIAEAIEMEFVRERKGWYAVAKCADAESSFVSDVAVAWSEV